MTAPGDELPIYVVFWNPSDYPGKYVVRAQLPQRDGTIKMHPHAVVVDTLEAARAAVPPMAVNLGRRLDDDPVIVEVWV